MQIHYFDDSTLLVEHNGMPYAVNRTLDAPPELLRTVPGDSLDLAFQRFMKFGFSPWYYGRVLPKPRTTAKKIAKLFEALSDNTPASMQDCPANGPQKRCHRQGTN